jgi:hypothetical protein
VVIPGIEPAALRQQPVVDLPERPGVLDVSHGPLVDDGLQALGRARHLGRLTRGHQDGRRATGIRTEDGNPHRRVTDLLAERMPDECADPGP